MKLAFSALIVISLSFGVATQSRQSRPAFEKLSPEHPQEVLIGLKKSEAVRFDLYRLNLQTGDSELVLKNDSMIPSFVTMSFDRG